MTIRNEKLYRATKAYVAEAIAFIGERVREDPHFSEDHCHSDWVYARCGADFSKLPRYSACLTALEGDDVIRPRLNQQVGLTPSAANLMKRLLDLGITGSHEFDPRKFDEEYGIFEETFYNDRVVCDAIAVVEGLLWQEERSILREGLEISQWKQEGTESATTDDGLHRNSLWAVVRKTYQVPKFFRDEDDQGAYLEQQKVIEKQVADEIEQVVSALRVFANCFDFYYPGIRIKKPRWLFEQDRRLRNRAIGGGFGSYLLQRHDCQAFAAFWRKLEEPEARRELDVALRRLGDSCIRYRNEDKLIDLIIAAESLFGPGRNTISKAEVIARSASRYLTSDHAMQEQIKEEFRLAYKLRNSIIHEGRIEASALSGDEAFIGLVGRIQDYLRYAIKKKCDEVSLQR